MSNSTNNNTAPYVMFSTTNDWAFTSLDKFTASAYLFPFSGSGTDETGELSYSFEFESPHFAG